MNIIVTKNVVYCTFVTTFKHLTRKNIQALIHGDEIRTLELKKTTVNFLGSWFGWHNSIYITGYITMLYLVPPNHPMQSYYLTHKGRELLNNL